MAKIQLTPGDFYVSGVVGVLWDTPSSNHRTALADRNSMTEA